MTTKAELKPGSSYYVYLLDQHEWWVDCILLAVEDNGIRVQPADKTKPERMILYSQIDRIAEKP